MIGSQEQVQFDENEAWTDIVWTFVSTLFKGALIIVAILLALALSQGILPPMRNEYKLGLWIGTFAIFVTFVLMPVARFINRIGGANTTKSNRYAKQRPMRSYEMLRKNTQ